MENQLIIYCLGPEGTYTHEVACSLAASRRSQLAPAPKIAFGESNFKVLERFEQLGDPDSLAVVAIENSSEGLVPDTRRFWRKRLDAAALGIQTVRVVGERHLPVRHCLATFGEGVMPKKVLSYPSALGQCAGFLERNGIEGASATSTAEAARLVGTWLADPEVGAICSKFAAERYRLHVRPEHEGIEDQIGNETRFHIVGHEPTEPTGSDRMALMFEIEDKPGALYHALGAFAAHGVNFSSQGPVGLGPGRYAQYLEADCHEDDPQGQKVLTCLRTLIVQDRLLVLGSYPRSPRPTEGGAQ